MKISGNIVFFVIGILVLASGSLMSGCGKTTPQVSASPLPTASPTSNPSNITTISGKLYSGTIRASSIKSAISGIRILADAENPILGNTIVAIGTEDKKVYFPDSKTDASGDFTISDLPSGESFYLEIIDSENRFVAPVSFAATGDAVVMAVTPESGKGPIDLGRIVYESEKGSAVPSIEISASNIDINSTAEHKSGDGLVPVGAGNLGRGTGESYVSDPATLKNTVDEDGDGIPDVLDIDDNGNGTVDGLDPTPRLPGATEIKVDGISNTNFFSNFTRTYVDYPTYINGSLNTDPIDVATVTNLAIETVMASGTSPNNFSDVRVVDGPAWVSTAKVAAPSGPLPLWSDDDYKLTKGSDRWDIHVIPYGTPEAGDVVKFSVTSTAGLTQEFISTITYLFHDIPRLVGYSYIDGATVVTKEASDLNAATYEAGAGGVSNAFAYTGSNITFMWTLPKDDLGNYVSGMDSYLDGIVYTRNDSSMFNESSKLITPNEVSDPTFGKILTYTFATTTEPFSHFKVDIKSQNPVSGGGNASQMVNFVKI